VPWVFDDEAVDVTRTFTKLKLALMPYLYAAGLEATATGTPVLRPMQLEFGDDPATGYLDRQYMLGADLLVSPVFTADGSVEFYLPAGTWTSFFTGETVTGPGWRRETHGFQTLPLYVRDGAVLPIGARADRPDYNYLDGLTLQLYPSSLPEALDGSRQVTVTTPDGDSAVFTIQRSDGHATVTSPSSSTWSVRVVGGQTVATTTGEVEIAL
jgi:alpha-D-xyloside xylohydrolase